MRVLPAVPADAGSLTALETDCQGRDAWSANLVAQGVSGELPTVTWLVTDDLAGYAVLSVAGDIGELQRIGVAADRRREGVATALLRDVVRMAAARGADRLLLEVRETNGEALGFYAAHGFVEIDRRPRYYADAATAVVMRLPLVKGCG